VQLYIQAEAFLEFIYLPEVSTLNSSGAIMTNLNIFWNDRKQKLALSCSLFCLLKLVRLLS